MSNAEGDDRMTPMQQWSYRIGRGAIEDHLGGRLRALYDALPEQPPSDEILTQLHRLDEAARGEGRPRTSRG